MSHTAMAFVAVFVLALLLAFVRHPRYALYAYLAVYYLDPPARWWGASLPAMRWSLFASIVMLFATLRLPPRPGVTAWYATTPARVLILLTIWMWIQNLWALAPPEHFEASVLFTKYVLLFAVMYRLMETPADVSDVLLLHFLGCTYLGWLAHIAPPGGRLEGVGGPGIDDANGLGMFMATGVVCGAMLILAERGWKQWVTLLGMPFVVNTIVQSQSRGAMLALVIGGLVLFYLKPKPYTRLFYVFAIAGALAFAYVAHDSFWERMKTLTATVQKDGEIDDSAESRVVVAKAQVRMALDYPLGAGHRGTAALSPRYLDEHWLTKSPDDPFGFAARSSHNTFMSAWVEQGIPGAILFLWLVAWVARSIFALRRYRAVAADPRSTILVVGPAIAASAVVVLVAGNFTDYLKTEVQFWMYAMLAATISVLVAREKTAGASARLSAAPATTESADTAPTRGPARTA